MNADRSASARTRHIRARALAGFHAGNPNIPEGGRSKTGMGAEALVARLSGQVAYTTVNLGLPNTVESGCDCEVETCTLTNITGISGTIFTPSGPYSSYGLGLAVTWNPIPNGSVYLITQPGVSPQDFELTSSTSGNYYTDNAEVEVILYAHVTGCPDISGTTPAPCFLAGALVTLGDGTSVPIENVRVGDIVLGAFGELNTILALHRPLLGANTMTAINGEHHTSSHHPHISADKKFYAVKPAVVEENTYGQFHEVIDADGVRRKEFLHGLNKGRVQLLTLGVSLKTVEGSRSVASLYTYSTEPDTQLYNLVVSGSHTYHVDGYAVTGWPREDDFDYDTWAPKTVE